MTSTFDFYATSSSRVDDFVAIILTLVFLVHILFAGVAVFCCPRIRSLISESSPAPPNPPAAILNSLPKVTFSLRGDIGSVVLVDCAICLGEFMAGDQLRILPECGHPFHVECIDRWLATQPSCPICRRVLVAAAGQCEP